MKETLCTVIGVIGAFIARVYGGWDAALTTLVIFMAIDYVTGFIVAAVFHKSEKTQNGALESKAGFIGLCKKGVVMLIVLMACRLDMVVGSTFIKDATVIAFITNETISIIENAAAMGVPIPSPIVQAIDILVKRGENNENGGGID
jgi:toxin secretion/phage lysis holin